MYVCVYTLMHSTPYHGSEYGSRKSLHHRVHASVSALAACSPQCRRGCIVFFAAIEVPHGNSNDRVHRSTRIEGHVCMQWKSTSSYHDANGLRAPVSNIGTVISDVIVVTIIIVGVTTTVTSISIAIVSIMAVSPLTVAVAAAVVVVVIMVLLVRGGRGCQVGDGIGYELRRRVGGLQSFSRESAQQSVCALANFS